MSSCTLRQLLEEAAIQLDEVKVPDPRYDARALLLSSFQLSTAQYLLYEGEALDALIPRILPDREALHAAEARFRSFLERRCRREPLQQILGTTGFYGLDFVVTRDVLCPRADTETLVDAVLGNLMPEQIAARSTHAQEEKTGRAMQNVKAAEKEAGGLRESMTSTVDKWPAFLQNVDNADASLLDVCTGSGCIAVSLAKFGAFREVTAVDISDAALTVAQENVTRLLTSSVDFTLLRSDMFSALAERTGEDGERKRYDVIVSNPPYIPSAVVDELEPEVRDYEPRLALDGTADGLHFYRILAQESGKYLNPGGRLYLEIGYDQGRSVPALLEAAGFQEVTVIRDFGGHDRVVAGHL